MAKQPDMSGVTQSLAAIDGLLNLYKSLQLSKTILSDLQNAQQVKVELAQANEVAARDLAKVRDEIEACKDELLKAKADARALVNQATKTAQDKIAKAETDAETVLREATDKAKQIDAGAAQIRQQSDELLGQIAAKQQDLKVIESKIADAKGKLAAFVNG